MAPHLKGDVDTLPPKTKSLRGKAASMPKTIQQRHISYELSGEHITSFLAVATQANEDRMLSIRSEVPSDFTQGDDIEQFDEWDCQFKAAGLRQLVIPPAATIPSVQPSKHRRTQVVNI